MVTSAIVVSATAFWGLFVWFVKLILLERYEFMDKIGGEPVKNPYVMIRLDRLTGAVDAFNWAGWVRIKPHSDYPGTETPAGQAISHIPWQATIKKLAREIVVFCLIGILTVIAISFVFERGKIISEKSPFVIGASMEPLWGPNVPRDTGDAAQRILLDTPVSDDTKSAIWHAFYGSKNAEEFSQKLSSFDLPEGFRSQLTNASNNVSSDIRSRPYYLRDDHIEVGVGLAWSDVPRLLEGTFGYGVLIGTFCGISTWIFYRLIRFAIFG